MFNSRATHRRKRTMVRAGAKIVRSVSRRLRLEAMEGRLMLSVTNMDVTTLSSPIAELTSQPANQPVYVATFAEDGYIPISSPPSGPIPVSEFGVPRSNLSSDALQTLITNGTLATAGNNTWTYVNAADTVFGGIRPVVIVADYDGSFHLIPTPTRGEDIESVSAPEEGGLISIESILEEVPRIEGEISEGSRTALVADTTDALPEQRQLTAAQAEEEAMSGELERAIVFEMAGGDPVGIEHPVTRDAADNANSLGGVPLSLRRLHLRSAEQTSKEVADGGSHGSPARDSGEVTGAVLEHPRSFSPGGNWLDVPMTLATIISKTVNENADPHMLRSDAHSDEARDSAYDEAFDQFAKKEKSAIYSLADGASRRSLSAIPLLAMLVLERVAARNSRRANKEASAVVRGQAALHKRGADRGKLS